jgi:hypothetical protein
MSRKCALTVDAIMCPPKLLTKLLPDLISEIRNTAFCKKNETQYERIHNKFLYSEHFTSPHPHESREVFGGSPTSLIHTIFNPCSADINHIDGKTKLILKWQRHRIKHQHRTQPSLRNFPTMTEVKNVRSGSKQQCFLSSEFKFHKNHVKI